MRAIRCLSAFFISFAVLSAASAAPTAITPQLVDAAKKEGKVVFYTSIELQTAEKIGKAFEAAYPDISVQVERNGCERLFQRLAEERGSNIHVADAIECSDMTALLYWKRQSWLAPFVPAEVAEKWPADQRDPEGYFATERFTLSPITYNTKLVKAEDAPKSLADLLDKKWTGKIVKAHPGCSGTIMTVTFELSRDLGWDYLKKLGQQRVMQVQSAAEPPKKVAQGERPIGADGGEYFILQIRDQGGVIEPVYPSEGTPSIPGGAGVIIDAAGCCRARATAACRYGLAALLPPRREAQSRDEAALRNQDPESRPRRAGKSRRPDQEELRRVFRAVVPVQRAPHPSPLPASGEREGPALAGG
jgi:iron(III) transport system substrate-binding protein